MNREVKKNTDYEIKLFQVQILSLSLSCVTLGKLLNFSGPHSTHPKNGDSNIIKAIELLWELNACNIFRTVSGIYWVFVQVTSHYCFFNSMKNCSHYLILTSVLHHFHIMHHHFTVEDIKLQNGQWQGRIKVAYWICLVPNQDLSIAISYFKSHSKVGEQTVTQDFWFSVQHAAAAATSLQSCPTLCDPIDSSPPGFPVPGILQARTLEWVAISFSNAWKWKVKVKSLSRVRLQRPHGLQPTRLLCPWDFPGKSTGVGCHCLLRQFNIPVSNF